MPVASRPVLGHQPQKSAPRLAATGVVMPISDYILRSFRLNDPTDRGPVIDAVRAAGFSIENIQEDMRHPQKWGLILKPNRRLSELFRLDREVLLWCSTYPRFQARDIDDMKVVLSRMGVRLSRSFAILVSRYDPHTRSRVEAESSLDTTIVHCSFDELSAKRPGDEPALQRILLDRLYVRDLYDLPSAAIKAADFFGRRDTIDDIADELITGQSQVGVFGLRKIGKTSLTNRVTESVAQSGRCIVAKIDLQWTTSIDPRPEYTLWALGEALYASGRVARSTKGLKLFGQYATATDAISAGLSVWEAFAHDLTAIIHASSRRVVIAVDEIERLFELPDKSSFVRLWRVLRGLDQQFPGRLKYLISGTSPECAESATISGLDNPLYRYLSIRYLGPLDPRDAQDLLVNLGSPIGLRWTNEGLSYALEQTGGHPALLRTLGSLVHSSLLPRHEAVDVVRNHAVLAARSMVSAHSAVLAQVTASLEDQYPDEFVMLKMLAEGQVYNFRMLASEYVDEMSHLIGYGLLPDGDRSEALSIGLLQSYLQARQDRPQEGPGTPVLRVGDHVGGRVIVARIRSGGFADVLVAQDEKGEKVAVKAFRAARLSALEREVEYLQSLSHPGIVRFIEATQAPGGVPCIVMEYLEGSTLADMCNATLSPDTASFLSIASRLLDALSYMHPSASGAAALMENSELTPGGFEDWERLRYGVVHRDIKPENIIIADRGPVLIDFNISVRAADPVQTISSTPGYLPPDFNGISWTPDVDIFQLGVTLAQLAAGARFDGENLKDLLTLAGGRHGDVVGSWLRTLVADSDRPTASDAKVGLPRTGN
ncbi:MULTISPECIES: protein kinase [unclassified Micromonospora]|uniref:protein kinase domain-containing protein n=1 Tax=unclassified Micromonospora TaxID=2617518 RepID=UPI0013D31E6F|nr:MULTISPECIES: protein kinase [unclassified Micromonospora]NES16442.1 protein kinase [Micromonospora sp. PPF5-17B]NES57158.1 protein kinase [Micromonospora sp. PPF5-6]